MLIKIILIFFMVIFFSCSKVVNYGIRPVNISSKFTNYVSTDTCTPTLSWEPYHSDGAEEITTYDVAVYT